MKILFIANGLIGEEPGLTGGETRFIEIAKVWAADGHQIHLMSSQSGKRLCRNFNLDVILHDFPCLKVRGRWTYILRVLKSTFFALKLARDFPAGVIYSTSNMLFDSIPALCMKIKKGRRLKWVSLVHMLPPFPPWRRKKSNFLSSILYFINEIGSLWIVNCFADIILAVSQATAGKLRHIGINMKKVYPVECGVDYARIRNIANDKRNKLYDAVSVKRLQAVKGTFDLIEIWQRVLRVKPDARLVLVGEGIDAQKARDLVTQRGLSKNIQFTGPIYDFEEKIKIIAASKLFLMPSYEENWGIVVGEAMACGTPVIAYGLADLIEVWKDYFIHVSVGDELSFAKRIIDLIDRPDVLSEISRKGIEYAKKYNWQDIAEKELQLILGDRDEKA